MCFFSKTCFAKRIMQEGQGPCLNLEAETVVLGDNYIYQAAAGRADGIRAWLIR